MKGIHRSKSQGDSGPQNPDFLSFQHLLVCLWELPSLYFSHSLNIMAAWDQLDSSHYQCTKLCPTWMRKSSKMSVSYSQDPKGKLKRLKTPKRLRSFLKVADA